MTQCHACGRETDGQLAFCTSCGTPLGAAGPPSSPAPGQPAPGTGSHGAVAQGPTQPAPGAPGQQWATQVPGAGVPPQGPAAGAAGQQQWAPGAGQPAQSTGDTPQFWQPATSRRSRGPVVAVVLLLVAALGIGGFAVWKVFFSAQGGAGSPEEAVTELVEATAEQDGVAMLQMINPAEARGADEVYDALRERADDAGISDDGEVTGVSFDVSDLDVEVEELSEHAAKVTVAGGTIDIEVDFDALPDKFAEVAADGRREHGDTYSETVDLADFQAWAGAPEDLFMIAVEDDGRWYVSPLATFAEWFAVSEGVAGDWELYEEGRDRDPVTGDTPEEALGVLADSFRLDDLNAFLDALPPGQGDLLRPYTALLEEDARNGGAPDIRFEFHGEELSVGDEEDGLVRVDLDRVLLEQYDVARPDVRVEYGLDGPCVQTDEVLGSVSECIPRGLLTAADEDGVFVMVRKVDGGWQLDPMATLIGWADAVVANLSEDEVDAFVDGLAQLD